MADKYGPHAVGAGQQMERGDFAPSGPPVVLDGGQSAGEGVGSARMLGAIVGALPSQVRSPIVETGGGEVSQAMTPAVRGGGGKLPAPRRGGKRAPQP